MTVGRRVSELTMGWCLNCHETHPSIRKITVKERSYKWNLLCELRRQIELLLVTNRG